MASQNPAQLRRRFQQVVPLQFLLATTWILAANLVAGWAFPRLFGATWANAIPYLRALSVAYLLQIVLHPVSGTLQLLERQAMSAVWQVCRLVLVVIAVLVPWWSGLTAVNALWVSALTETVCCLTLLALTSSMIEKAVVQQQKGG